ncbi:MAG: class I SAM-dependent methyltransferase [Ignavibacteriae bacterium]|nr:class I SAM-dependent methyltransferase [Ignavibacteriota bacterium]
MFSELEKINLRPKPFEFYTADELWTDEHTSKKMLEFHLNEDINVSSRNLNFIVHSVNWITSSFVINSHFSICDFGCGPGLYTTLFAEKGAKVTGIDFSKRSIEYAKKVAEEKCFEIDYVNQNYLLYETDKRFDLITMIMCDYCALSPDQREIMLQKFFKILKPEGSILLDVYTLELFKKRLEQTVYGINLLNGFWSSEKYYGFLNTFKYEEEKVILDKFTIIEKNRNRNIYNWLQYFNIESISKEFERNKLIIENLYSDVAGSTYDLKSDEIAIVAKKAI